MPRYERKGTVQGRSVMSYEGYTEYITLDGDYFAHDCNDDNPPKKPYFMHMVDQTNGIDKRYPYTHNAPKKLLGNKWKPIGRLWELVK